MIKMMKTIIIILIIKIVIVMIIMNINSNNNKIYNSSRNNTLRMLIMLSGININLRLQNKISSRTFVLNIRGE